MYDPPLPRWKESVIVTSRRTLVVYLSSRIAALEQDDRRKEEARSLATSAGV